MFQTLAYYVALFHRSFVTYTTARLHQVGLSFGSLFPILYVGKHPGCSQAQLTAALNLDWGHSQRLITKLVEEGFLTREKSDRSYHLDLSPKGQETFEVSHQVFFDWDEKALASLSPAEQQQLLNLLAKVTRKEVDPTCKTPSKAL